MYYYELLFCVRIVEVASRAELVIASYTADNEPIRSIPNASRSLSKPLGSLARSMIYIYVYDCVSFLEQLLLKDGWMVVSYREEMVRLDSFGNDVSSGLKWALLSRSVVIMQTPTKTSYAMKELLQPWTHYIPIDDRFSDVEDKMK